MKLKIAMKIKLFLGILFLISSICQISFGQQAEDSVEHRLLVKNARGEVLEGVYMLSKRHSVLITSSDKQGYCYFDAGLLADSDSVRFVCLGYEDKVISCKNLTDTEEIQLVEKVYVLEDIGVKHIKPDVLLKKAAALMQQRSERVKNNYNYYGRGDFLKITECNKKAVEYRRNYGVFFTSGNTPKKNVLDEGYCWHFIGAIGAQSLSLTADGRDTLSRRAMLSGAYSNLGTNYDAGISKLSVFMRSILLYGPLFTSLKYYEFRLIDNSDGYTYEFKTRNTNSLKNIRIRCYGRLTIDPETARPRDMVFDYVDYNMCTWIRWDEWVESPYVTQADLSIGFSSDGLPYIRECIQKTVWKKGLKYEKSSGKSVLGMLPSRRGPVKNGLVEKEFFRADTYQIYPEWYRSDQRFYAAFFQYGGMEWTKYDKDFLSSLPVWPGEAEAKRDLDAFMDLEEQFERHNKKFYYAEYIEVHKVNLPFEMKENIIDVFIKEKAQRLVIIGEDKYHFQVGVR